MNTEDQKRFVQDLETVIYGCHAQTRDELTKVFAKYDLFTFAFAEYFLDEPVVREADVEKRTLYFPFLQRAARDLKYWIRSDQTNRSEPTQFLPKTRQYLRDVRLQSLKGEALSSEQWKFVLPVIQGFARDKKPNHVPLESDTAVYGLMKTGASAAANYSYDIQVHLWAKGASVDTPIRVLRIPIASKSTLYGYIAITYRVAAEDASIRQKKTDDAKLEPDIDDLVPRLVEKRYVPVLTLLHVGKWERALRKSLKEEKKWPDPSPMPTEWQAGPNDDELESAFGNLWQKRKAHLDTEKYSDTAIKTILKTIVLHEYHIASPAMVKQVQEVILGAKLMKQPSNDGDPLPSALIFGEAGSGKDKMARLIPTLTRDYWEAQITTQNMAAIKPAQLAVPLMFGAQMPSFLLPGMFQAAKEPRVFILDELNSLDYDMQGSLLRLLENGEVAPLFSRDSQGINALIIGIVNEDPDQVTRENELRLLKDAEEFLGKAEAARLYDSLLRTRRLRPDLVYRLKRGIYLRMPSLRQRVEDIPLLFQKDCSIHLKKLCDFRFGSEVVEDGKPVFHLKTNDAVKLEVTVEYELEAFDVLMRPELPWPGNLRQLQAVARKAADKVWGWWLKNNENRVPAEKQPTATGNVEIEVRRPQIETVLRDEFPEHMGITETDLDEEESGS